MHIFLFWCSLYIWMVLFNLLAVDYSNFHYYDLYIIAGIAFLLTVIFSEKITNFNKKHKSTAIKSKDILANEIKMMVIFTLYIGFGFLLSYSYIYKDIKALGNRMDLWGLVSLVALVVAYYITFIKKKKIDKKTRFQE